MQFDIRKVPFSRFGSYLAISTPYPDSKGIPDGLYLRTVHGKAMWKWSGLLRLEALWEGKLVPAEVVATPSLLQLKTSRGAVEFCFENESILRVRGKGLGLRLTWGQGGPSLHALGLAHVLSDERVRLQPGLGFRLMVTKLTGAMDAHVQWECYRQHHLVRDFKIDCGHSGKSWEIAIEEFDGEWIEKKHPKTFAACVKEVRAEVAAWNAKAPALPRTYAKAGELAAYVNWTSVVRPHGHLKRRGMLMSKNWMHAVWSWDNCFNALAVAGQDARLAWEQLMLLVDQQDAQGAFPDYVTNDHLKRGFVKPPIHGWTLRKLMHSGAVGIKQLREIYEPLCKSTEWWFRWRDVDGDGIPEYFHGNDSGWDNCTLFDVGYPLKGPDLIAFLALQMEVLGEVAHRLGKTQEAARWTKRSKNAIRVLVREFWDGTRFVAKSIGNAKSIKAPASLLSYLPAILGKRLPKEILATMVEHLKTEGFLLTRFGLASESPRSSRFIADGYWRGAIWAPPIALIVDGLYDAGEIQLAQEISRRFCELCKQSGFAENFNAITGEALRDPAYTWTSSIFLLLASGALWGNSKPSAQ